MTPKERLTKDTAEAAPCDHHQRIALTSAACASQSDPFGDSLQCRRLVGRHLRAESRRAGRELTADASRLLWTGAEDRVTS